MCQLLETIRLVDGKAQNLEYHQARFEKSFFEVFQLKTNDKLEALINCPDSLLDDIVKCRVLYYPKKVQIEYQKYLPKVIRSFKMVHADHLDYEYKYADRTAIDQLHEQKMECDDIIIVKNGLLTDSSFANLVFSDGINFYTPEIPLLNGTSRQKYLDEGVIKPMKITLKNFRSFKTVQTINAMLDLEKSLPVSVSNCLG